MVYQNEDFIGNPNKLDLVDADDDAVEYLTVDDYPFENPDDPDLYFFHDNNDIATDTEEDDYDDDDDFEYFSTDNPLSDSSEILVPAYEDDESYPGESQFSDSDQETASFDRESNNDNRDIGNTNAETDENMLTEDKETDEVTETENSTS